MGSRGGAKAAGEVAEGAGPSAAGAELHGATGNRPVVTVNATSMEKQMKKEICPAHVTQ